jgi:large subunit ribosomal protein L25
MLPAMLTLEVKKRTADEKPEKLRMRGVVPAIFYGPKEEATAISIDERSLEHVWKTAGQTSVITLEGLGEKKDTLIHDVQFHPVTGKVLHVDFYVLEKGKKIEIAVPLEWVGQAPAEKAGNIVVKALHEIEIEVEAAHLPHSLPVDLSKLEKVGDHIKASGIVLPPTATLITDPEETVVSVTEFKEEAEEVTPAPETVITTAKTPEGEAAAASPESAGEAKEQK